MLCDQKCCGLAKSFIDAGRDPDTQLGLVGATCTKIYHAVREFRPRLMGILEKAAGIHLGVNKGKGYIVWATLTLPHKHTSSRNRQLLGS